MKSTDVYKILRREIGPEFKRLGFRVAKGLLSYSLRLDNDFLVIWFQISHDGWDSFAGSKFTLEVQRSPEPITGIVTKKRKRISSFCNESELEQIRSLQNRIIRSLTKPPANHPYLHIEPNVSKYYLSKFERVDTPYTNMTDIWLRYSCENDVKEWALLINSMLPSIISQARLWA